MVLPEHLNDDTIEHAQCRHGRHPPRTVSRGEAHVYWEFLNPRGFSGLPSRLCQFAGITHAMLAAGQVRMNDIADIIASLRSALPDLRRQWPIHSLALFGSRVRDDATPVSDLDVLVAFSRPVPLSSFLA